jgi:hypothetical protein
MNGMARECHSVLVHLDLSRAVATRRPGLLLAQQAKHLPIYSRAILEPHQIDLLSGLAGHRGCVVTEVTPETKSSWSSSTPFFRRPKNANRIRSRSMLLHEL